MTVRLSTGLRNALAGLTGFGTTFNDGVIYIYSGPQPATADAAPTGTLLGVVTQNGAAFAFGAAANGLGFDAPVAGTVSKAAAETWKATGLAAGVAGWFRLMGNVADALGSSTVSPRLDGSCAVSGGDLNISNLTFAVGTPQTVDVFQFTFPAQ